MRRLTLICCLIAALPVVFAATSSAGDARTYRVELFNAFGLVKDSDVKIAGVRAGTITDLDINMRKRAEATIELKPGIAGLRADAECLTKPQSLIAEYFIDCDPGKSSRELEPGALIPVERTASSVQPDLVNNILREPYRDRLRLIINEFGTGLAGRPEDLNRAVRSGAPALRETSRVLKVLGRQNKIIRDLNADSDEIIGALARNKKDVSRFITEARETAQASAERRSDISANFNRLPRLLAELEPTMARLGDVATEQTPLLTDLKTSASELERFTRTVGPFSDASVPSLETLGDAAKIGRRALSKGEDEISELRRFGEDVEPVSDDIAKLTTDLDDRGRAVEPDPRSPGGKGYTGFEGILNYAYYQAGSLNSFDKLGHSLRVSLLAESPCSNFAMTDYTKNEDGSRHICSAWLGPNQPGLTEQVCIERDKDGHTIRNFCPVPAYGPEVGVKSLRRAATEKAGPGAPKLGPTRPVAPQLPGPAPPSSGPAPRKLIPDLPGPLEDILKLPQSEGRKLPKLPGVGDLGVRGSRSQRSRRGSTTIDLLDFLFGN